MLKRKIIAGCWVFCLFFLGYPFSLFADTSFDEQTLLQLGINPDVAQFFSEEARFLPGKQSVIISINNIYRYEMTLAFDEKGQPCFDNEFAQAFDLTFASSSKSKVCHVLNELYPEAHIELAPQSSSIFLTLPLRAFDSNAAEYRYGGAAFLMNYNVVSQWSKASEEAASSGLSASFQPGINFKNWILRSHFSYSYQDRVSLLESQEVYLQRAVEPLKSLIQLGEINVINRQFSGLPMLGFQLYSDRNQDRGRKLIVPIEATVSGNTVVELRQYGRLVYQTVYSAGYFRLDNFPGLVPNVDIHVTLKTSDQDVREFTVSGRVLDDGESRESDGGGAFSAGWFRQSGDREAFRHGPWFITNDYSFSSPKLGKVNLASTFGLYYQSIAYQHENQWSQNVALAHQLQISKYRNRIGGRLSVNGIYRVADPLSISFYSSYFHSRYIDAYMGYFTSDKNRQSEKKEILMQTNGASISFQSKKWGGINMSGYHNFYYGSQSRNGWTINYNNQISDVKFNLSVQANNNDKRFYSLTVNIPLLQGNLSSSTYYQGDQQGPMLSMRYNNAFKQTPYTLSMSRNREALNLMSSFNIDTYLSSISINTSMMRSSEGSHYSLYSMLGGGMVLNQYGIALSNQPVGDTFAFIHYPKVKNLQLVSGGGALKTNRYGLALLPDVTPYKVEYVTVDGKSMPANLDLFTTSSKFNLAYGSVGYQRVESKVTKQLLLHIKLSDDQPVETGATIYGEANRFVGVSTEGMFLLVDDDIGQPLYLKNAHMPLCKIDYQLPDMSNVSVRFHEVDAICHPIM